MLVLHYLDLIEQNEHDFLIQLKKNDLKSGIIRLTLMRAQAIVINGNGKQSFVDVFQNRYF